AGVLVDTAYLGVLAHGSAGLDGRLVPGEVELVAPHHRQQRTATCVPGERPVTVVGERDGGNRVSRGYGDLRRRKGERGADQAAAAGLVARMLRPFQHDRARAGGRR